MSAEHTDVSGEHLRPSERALVGIFLICWSVYWRCHYLY